MARDSGDAREALGRHFVRKDDSQQAAPADAGTEVPEGYSLNGEEREMRNAGRKLANSDEDSLQEMVLRLNETIKGQSKCIDQLAERLESLDGLLDQFRQVADDLRETKGTEADEEHYASQAVIMGVGQAQQQAKDEALRDIRAATVESRKSIQEVKDETSKYLKSLTEQSKVRIERLARVTLPDKLFETLKWVVMTLLLVILVNAVWQLFT